MLLVLPDRQKLWQFVFAVIVSYGNICVGMSMGWSSPVLPKLRNVTLSPLDYVLNEQQESWIGSLLILGAISGPIIATFAMVWVGRKLSIISLCLPLILGWILTTSATTLDTIYVGRFFGGIAVGMQFTVIPIYLSEISETAVRGAMGSMFELFLHMGFFAGYAIGPFVSYRIFGIIGCILSIIYPIGLCFVPETPGYLMMKGRHDDAMKALKTIRGKDESEVREEYDRLKLVTQKLLEDKTKVSKLWTSRSQLKALLMCSFLAMLIQFSGIDILQLYMQVLLMKIGSGIPARESTICLGVVQVVSSCVMPVVIDRLGRRLLMYITSLIMSFCLIYNLSYFGYFSGRRVPQNCDALGMHIFDFGRHYVDWKTGTIIVLFLVAWLYVASWIMSQNETLKEVPTTNLIRPYNLLPIGFIIGLYAFFDANKYDFVSSLTWLPMMALVIYFIAFSLGVGPVPWILVGEMFPAKSKPVAAGIASISCWVVGFIWTRYFADIERALGTCWAYWFLAIACFIGFLFSILMLPETKGKTFEEIQDLLHNKKTSKEAKPTCEE